MKDEKSTKRQNSEDRRQKIEDCPERSRRYKCLFSVLCPLSSAICALLLVGCAQQQSFSTRDETRGTRDERRETRDIVHHPSSIVLRSTDVNKADVMKISEDVLAKMHFTIEKADVETGLITTKPLRGAQFFEFWRSDNVGAFNTYEANLHTIRRTVQLRISQLVTAQAVAGVGQNEGLCIDCDVLVQRLNLPQHQAATGSQAYQIFSKSSASTQRLILSPEQKRHMEWVDLGNDTKLATEILKRIEQQIVTCVP